MKSWATYVTFVHHASTRICIGTVKIKYRMAENCLSSSHMNTVDNEKLVRPNDKLHNILLEAGAVKQILTMKEPQGHVSVICRRGSIF
ncbi:hypothetical protein DPEC_G00082910 [Dallia pectoralis]|uniref:Uncharacterized protein n=1 Tax=Dallia pectoralis TaxID=75939 RepID=A0ACC2GZ17_DALPE|nr:hypothetical protein DPEC_G00082910 [Dallia pectoralis]